MKNILTIISSIFLSCLSLSCSQDAASLQATPNSGKGGSLARFTVKGNYLYTVDNEGLNVFDISSPSNISLENQVYLGFGIETIFPYQQHLFIGSQEGMHILDIQNPVSPQKISVYSHIRSCDPVVVQGNYAYVTLRQESFCGGGLNQLDVVDISNVYAPQLKKSYPMRGPYGLGIDGDFLFVCDGDAGLKAFKTPNTPDLSLFYHNPSVNTYDVIPLNGNLLMIGEDGLFQYQYTQQAQQMSMQWLSTIPVQKP
jgi:hypothetical protein